MAFWFDKVLDPITVTASQELSLVLGTKTCVQLTGAAGFSVFGLAQIGGNVAGAVVTFFNLSNSGIVTYSFDNQSGSASAVNRFFVGGGSSALIGASYGGITFRYSAQISRWVYLSSG